MGHRITQRIYDCDICKKTPEDGEYLWNMNREVWCEDCCNKVEDEQIIQDESGEWVTNKQN